MLKITRFVFLAVILISVTTACNPYQKMLNNPDVSAKYKAAEAYYNTGEYRRANRLYEQILPSYRGKPQAQRVIFFFANSYLQTKDYYLAAYQFESFVKSFPKSDKIQEASFLAAKCYYMLSPRYSLDQTNTTPYAITNLRSMPLIILSLLILEHHSVRTLYIISFFLLMKSLLIVFTTRN